MCKTLHSDCHVSDHDKAMVKPVENAEERAMSPVTKEGETEHDDEYESDSFANTTHLDEDLFADIDETNEGGSEAAASNAKKTKEPKQLTIPLADLRTFTGLVVAAGDKFAASSFAHAASVFAEHPIIDATTGQPFSAADVRANLALLNARAAKRASVRAVCTQVDDYLHHDDCNALAELYPDFPVKFRAGVKGNMFRPRTGMNFYLKERAAHLTDSGQKTMPALIAAWNELSDEQKAPYQQRAEDELHERNTALIAFYQRHPELRMPDTLRRETDEWKAKMKARREGGQKQKSEAGGITPFSMFFAQKRDKYMENFCQALRKAERAWEKMNEEARAPFVEECARVTQAVKLVGVVNKKRKEQQKQENNEDKKDYKKSKAWTA